MQTVGSRGDAIIRAIGGAQQVLLLDNADTREGVGYAISAVSLDVELLGRDVQDSVARLLDEAQDSEIRIVGEMAEMRDQVVVEIDSLGQVMGDGLSTLGYAVAAASYDVDCVDHGMARFESRMVSRTLFDLHAILNAIAQTYRVVDAVGDELAEQMGAAESAIVNSLQTTSHGVSVLGQTLGNLIRFWRVS
jgi:hypothetical protein